MYLDGSLVGSKPYTQTAYGGGGYRYQLGTGYTQFWPNTNGGWYTFNGLIDEAQVFNRPLTAVEVKSIFQADSQGVLVRLSSEPYTRCGQALGQIAL